MADTVIGLAFMLPILLIIGGTLVVLMAMYQRTKNMEMRHRERIAMIERGLTPAPEVDPARFDAPPPGIPYAPRGRSTTFGVALIGLGVAVMMLISFAAEDPQGGFGVGGAIAVLGVAFIVNGELQRRDRAETWRRAGDVGSTPSTAPPVRPSDGSGAGDL